jgi:L-fuconolactonase
VTDARLTFVDAHVHFWDGARISYPWLAHVPTIAGPHTPVELAAAVGARLPTQIVFVEAGAAPEHARDEVLWVEELLVREPRIAAIVAGVAVDRGDETEFALAALAKHPRVRGVRDLVQAHPEPDFCTRPAFVAGVRRVGAHGFSFDLCATHAQLRACTELVRACPETSFILDHAGKPDIRHGVRDPWRADITALAELPNVVCKLSGLVTEADPATWTPAVLQPYVDHLLSCFGPKRLLFGSDWPVVNLAANYQRWLDTVLDFLAPLSPDERNAVLSENARRIYRLA